VPGPFRFWRVTITVLMCVSLAWMLPSVVKEGALTEKYAGIVAVPVARDIKGAEQLQHHVAHNGARF
jgi:hypothetical protein